MDRYQCHRIFPAHPPNRGVSRGRRNGHFLSYPKSYEFGAPTFLTRFVSFQDGYLVIGWFMGSHCNQSSAFRAASSILGPESHPKSIPTIPIRTRGVDLPVYIVNAATAGTKERNRNAVKPASKILSEANCQSFLRYSTRKFHPEIQIFRVSSDRPRCPDRPPSRYRNRVMVIASVVSAGASLA
jgi:hypothetical protein